VHVSTFASRAEAIGAEQQIKGWSRKKKEAFIKENFDLLQKLSNAKNNAKNKLKL
jgi:predicted GIY-YIG superfamily endonuclease